MAVVPPGGGAAAGVVDVDTAADLFFSRRVAAALQQAGSSSSSSSSAAAGSSSSSSSGTGSKVRPGGPQKTSAEEKRARRSSPRAQVEELKEERRPKREQAPLKRARTTKRLRVGFTSPIVRREHLVPALCDLPKWVRDEMYWGSEDYASIRDNQRRLIELVMRQVREYPEGVVPPPIPGESRRGLGIICEPGTNSGRAARVRSARRAVVEAYRDGYSSDMIGKLAQELSLWATKNAYDVGLKDHQAVGAQVIIGQIGFDYTSFREHSTRSVDESSYDSRQQLGGHHHQPMDVVDPSEDYVVQETTSSYQHHHQHQHHQQHGVAHAQRREDNDDVSSKSSHSARGDSEDRGNGETPADGLGLASMIRSDSYNNLLARNTSMSSDHSSPKHDQPDLNDGRVNEHNGLGLASMIRTDSLGNLAALDTSDDHVNDEDQRGSRVVEAY
eukprot:CAMPEP_0118889068 /NCGR_PEP_ID=MMETSP1166-20130328/169_1 /TAXON_ID=1104430 /ORGANISM="Chrysoreinhardia sp, Strain CCMP3193" /LENGTH=443 /DNA_ID=CAMNT_0006827653 /DNA_START=395 /DNA_END=1727 /DNA_ORIENTATION=+